MKNIIDPTSSVLISVFHKETKVIIITIKVL